MKKIDLHSRLAAAAAAFMILAATLTFLG